MIRKSIVPTNFKNYCLFLLCFTFLFTGIMFNGKSVRSQTVVTTISIGPEAGNGFAPLQVIVNPVTNLVYVSNSSNDSISVIDGETNKVIDNIKTEKMGGIDINSTTNRIYVVTLSGVSVIDGETNDIIITISAVGRPGWPVGVNSTTNFIYVIDRDRGNMCVIDGETNTIVDTIVLNEDASPVMISVNSFTNRIYVACKDNNVMVIDGETNRTIDIVKIGGRLSKVVVNPSTNRIYVQSNPPKDENSSLKVIDGETNRVINKIKLEGFVRGIGINPRTNSIYATVGDDSKFGTVNVIDGESNQVVNVVTVGVSPEGVAVNPITSAVYVANMEDDSVSVIDGVSNKPLDTIQIGESLYGGIGINYETNRVYVGSWSSKAIFVIDGNTNKIIDVARVVISPIGVPLGVGVNPTTNLIYVAIGNDDIVTVVDGSTNEVVKNIKHSTFLDIREIGVNPLTNRIYVTSLRGVSVIDGNTNSIIDFIIGVNSPREIGVNPATNLIYVVNPTNSVRVIDGGTNRVIDNILIPRLANIKGITVNSTTNRLYVGSFTASTGIPRQNVEDILQQGSIAKELRAGLCVISGKTNKVMDCLTSPISTVIGVNPTTNRIYAPDFSNINVIDGTKNEVIATVKVENGSKHAIGINTLSNLIYITNPRSGNVTVIKDDIQQETRDQETEN